MVLTAWRIVKAARAETAFDGEGARIEGGRWNSPGTPAVYTSHSAALATVEMLVHLAGGKALVSYVLIPCRFDRELVLQLDRTRLPKKWRMYPAPSELQRIGDAWLTSGVSAVLEVPSAIIDVESNFVLNPRHPDFKTVRVLEPQPFEFDLRLLKR